MISFYVLKQLIRPDGLRQHGLRLNLLESLKIQLNLRDSPQKKAQEHRVYKFYYSFREYMNFRLRITAY